MDYRREAVIFCREHFQNFGEKEVEVIRRAMIKGVNAFITYNINQKPSVIIDVECEKVTDIVKLG